MKKSMLMALAAVGLLAVSAGASASQWKEIRFGVEASYPPFESKAADGKLVGFDIDLGNEICKRLQAKCVWVENDFDGLIPALKARKFDGILSSMSVTEPRQKQIGFSSKLFNTPTRMLAKAGSGLMPTAASLKGKRVGVQQGTIQEAYAKLHWAAAGVEVVPYQSQNQVLADLKSGRLDATLQDAIEADQGFLQKPDGKGFAFAGNDLNDPKTLGVGSAVGLRKEDTALKAAIDQAIAGMLKDGTFKKIEARYFRFDVYGQ
ncbi:MAG: ABC transporter substrate-binding protein [Paludibacterium sp.]|uniref:ABC transporter substrate-binding protein n=1 Tax=Paludibacterium sp. TaxID=1917523 RepID=UPI0025DEED84|nr:ABC transporter substrate-binding protein [Paludibacterium sp.]MBV8049269.1 ABC transporter substrate-binding protein [Paludibacterium sp.]MBV8648283.1 ABC transporter substrate-binding protein [Paludibacterium sp.]